MPLTRTQIRFTCHLKWLLFRPLEWLATLRHTSAQKNACAQPRSKTPRRASMWFFLSTIGELNAIRPLLTQLIETYPHLQPVLITDHTHYVESYQAAFPKAYVTASNGEIRCAHALARNYPPALFFIAEIPLVMFDAPCRLPFAFLRIAKRHGAYLAALNGWLYGDKPACRMDEIEQKLFHQDASRLFDVLCVQNDDVKQRLITAGADATRIFVTGNLKFDALNQNWQIAGSRSPLLLHSLLGSNRPIVVAGCVTNLDEQNTVLDAFVELLKTHPTALLVLAPRHPEVVERMHKLKEFCAQRQLKTRFRSHITDQALEQDVTCLVLDTMGELRDFYALSNVAYVGVDHNVLEPLAFAKPVSVPPNWNSIYPSYPVYRLLLDAHAITEVNTAPELASLWHDLLSDPTRYTQTQDTLRKIVRDAQGATQKHIAALAQDLPDLTNHL